MKYNKLGTTEIEVSEICLGTMTFGEQNSELEGHEQMDYALDNGVNFFDTAEMYAIPSTKENNGKTEEIIGSWFAKTGNRDKVILATKVTGPSPNFPYIADNLGFSRGRVMEAIDRSLTRLQTDYVDLYQLHWPERYTNYFGQRGFTLKKDEQWEDNFADVLDTLNNLIKEGKIRHWGLSNETPYGTMRFLAEADRLGVARPSSIQNPYSLLNRTFEVGNAEVAIREDVGLLAYSPMAFGLLSGKYHKKTDSSRDRLNKYKQMSRYNSQICYDATASYIEIAEEYNMTIAQMCLAFVNQQDFLTSNIIGATTMEQLKENVESSDILLSDEVIKKIEKVHESMPNPAP